MSVSTQSIFKSIESNQLLGSTDLKKAREKWGKPGRDGVDDPYKLARWLAVNHYLSLYQADKLLLEKPEDLVVGPYRVKSRVETEPMAGWLLAEDNLHRQVYLQPVTAGKSATSPTLAEVVKTATGFRNTQVVAVLGLLGDRGREYLVRDFFSGDSLQNLVERKATLGALPAAKLFSLLFNAVAALTEKGIHPGELELDSFWIGPTPGSKSASPTKTVRIIDAGVPAGLLNPPDSKSHLQGKAIAPAEAVFRLAAGMYQALTGVVPYPEYAAGTKPWTSAGSPPASIATLRRDLPESIAHFLDGLLHPESAGKTESPAHAAKQLRVLISAEEHSAAQAEEAGLSHQSLISAGTAHGASPSPETEQENLSAADKFLHSTRHWLESMGIFTRDLIVFTAGALAFLFLLIVSLIFFKLDLVPFLCFGLGSGFGYAVERFFRSAEAALPVAEVSPSEENLAAG